MNNEEKEILEIKEEENGDTLTPTEEVDDNQEQPIQEEPNEVMDTEQPEPELDLDGNNEENLVEPEPETPKMFDQNYVNELVGRTRIEARDKAMRSLYDRYGVDTEDELNEIFGRGQSYNILNNDYNDLNTRYGDVMAENALLKSKTDESRWDDIRLILKGKGLDITPENIAMELTTHPEWMGSALPTAEGSQGGMITPDGMEQVVNNIPATENKPSAKIKRLGSDVPPTEETNEEEEFMNKYFGI